MRRVTILLVLAAFVFAVAGCGGSDNSSGETSTTTTTEETTTEETTTEATETDTDTETTTEAAGDFGSGDCLKLAQAASKLGEAFSATGADNTNLQDTADLYRQFADEAPEEIRADLRVLADAFAKYVDAIKGIDLSSGETPSADDLAKLQQAAASIDTAEVTAASERVSTWTNENCSNG